MIEGRLRASSDTANVEAGPGEVIRIEPGEAHSLWSVGDTRAVAVMVVTPNDVVPTHVFVRADSSHEDWDGHHPDWETAVGYQSDPNGEPR